MAAAPPIARRSIGTTASRVPPAEPAYTLRRVWLTEEEQDGYYYGFANEGLWPLCHIAFVRPAFRESDWEHYRAVNERFAEAVAQEAQRRRPDRAGAGLSFRLAAADDPRAPAAARRSSPSGTFPGRTPRRSASAPGRRRSSTACSAARSSASTPSSTATISSRRSTASSRAASTASMPRSPSAATRPCPALSDLDRMAAGGARRASAGRRVPRRAFAQRFGLAADVQSPSASSASTTPRASSTACVDRHAADRHPEWKGRFTFVQVAAPTRSKLASYSALQSEAIALAERSTRARRCDTSQSGC